VKGIKASPTDRSSRAYGLFACPVVIRSRKRGTPRGEKLNMLADRILG